MTVSFSVKGEQPTALPCRHPPGASEPGTKAKRLRLREAEQCAEIGTKW